MHLDDFGFVLPNLNENTDRQTIFFRLINQSS